MPGCPGEPILSPFGGALLGTVDIVEGYPLPTLFNDPLNTSSTGGPSLSLMEDAHDMAYDLATDSILHSALEDDGGSCSCCCVDLSMTGPTFMHQWFMADDNPTGTPDGWASRDYWPGGSTGLYMNLKTSYTYHFNVGQYEPCEEVHGGLYSFRLQDDADCWRERNIPLNTPPWTYYSSAKCGKTWGYQEPALAYALFGTGPGFIYGGTAWFDYRVRSVSLPSGGFEYLSLCLPCLGFDEEPCVATCANAQHYGHQNPTEPATGPGYQYNFPYIGSVFESENCEVDPCSPNGLCFGPGTMAGPGPTACFSNNSLLDGSGAGIAAGDNVCFDCESKALFHPCYNMGNTQTANNWGTNPDTGSAYPPGNSQGSSGNWDCAYLEEPGNDSFGAPIVGATAWGSAGGPLKWAVKYNFVQDETRWDECCTYRTIGCVDPSFANYNAVASFGGFDCDGDPDPNDEYTYWDASFPNPCGGGTGCMMCETVPSTANIGPGMNQNANLVDALGTMINFENPAVVTACCLLSGNGGVPIHPLGWNNTDSLFTGRDCCSNAGCMDSGAGAPWGPWLNGPVNVAGPGPTHAAQSPFLGTAPYYPGYDVTIGNVSTPISLTQSPIAATNYSVQFTQDCTQMQGGTFTFPNECCEYNIPGCGTAANAGGGPNPDIFGNGGYAVWNFNPYVTYDDGSCFEEEPIGGCVDNGGSSSQPQLPSTVPVPPFWPQHPGIPANNFNPVANIATNTCVWLYGCPDPYANNYDPCVDIPANVACLGTGTPHPIPPNDVYPVVALMSMCNYDIAGAGPGCMDPQALNYNPLSTQDCTFDVTYPANCLGVTTGPYCCCLYPVDGCTDHNATNYNPLAVNDDGSCEYDISTTQEGINWLYGTKVLLCRDPLTKEEVLMGVCDQPEIQSEIFIERGKQSVMEPNLRLGEITTMGGLINHGYKYFRIKKQ